MDYETFIMIKDKMNEKKEKKVLRLINKEKKHAVRKTIGEPFYSILC